MMKLVRLIAGCITVMVSCMSLYMMYTAHSNAAHFENLRSDNSETAASSEYVGWPRDEQLRFLKAQGKPLTRRIKQAVNNPSGMNFITSVPQLKYNAERNEVRFIFEFRGQQHSPGANRANAIRAFQRDLCEWRAESRLAFAKSSLVVQFNRENGKPKLDLRANRVLCRHLG